MPGRYQGSPRRDDNRGRRDAPQNRHQADAQPTEQGFRAGGKDWEKKLEKVKVNDEFVSKELIEKLLRQGGKSLVNTAEQLGPLFKDGGLTTSQIRNIFGQVKQMEMSGFDAEKFILLKPKLAYAAARAGKDGAHQFSTVLTWAIDEVDTNDKKFERFVDFFEAILAYHKAAGGK